MIKSQKAKIWVTGYLLLVTGALLIIGFGVVYVDPFFHYHKPNIDKYYYILDDERSQNDGISKHFDYDAMITGTSMTQNFKTSEMDEIFGTHSIKVPYSGASYKEINDNLVNALEHNPDLKIIVRGLDMNKYIQDKDAMRFDLGIYPTYLYDEIWYNDIEYIFNRNVVFERVCSMVTANDVEGFMPGMTTFDNYSNWMESYAFGRETVCPNGINKPSNNKIVHLSEEEKTIVLGNVHQNITSLAYAHPDVTFYYFFTPYSVVWWGMSVDDGSVYKQIEAEQLVIEEVLKCDNIKLYSFNNLTDIITDLNNYKDNIHYGSWINSLMLRYMKDEKCLLTYDNYRDYLELELSFFTSYDYSQLNDQVDYDNDYYAEAVLNYEINGVEPFNILDMCSDTIVLNQTKIIKEQYDGEAGLQCKGSLTGESEDESPVSDYAGAKVMIEDISKYKYLIFYGRKNQGCGQPNVYICGQNGVILLEFSMDYHDLDDQWHQYLMDVDCLDGPVTIVFNGGYMDSTGDVESMYTFSKIELY